LQQQPKLLPTFDPQTLFEANELEAT